MKLEDFIMNFADQFDDTDVNTIKADTLYKELDEWNSLVALSVISMVDDEYGVALKGDDIRTAETIQDLFNIVESRA